MTESSEQTAEQTKLPQLKRELGLIGVFSLAAGAMISSGLFVLPGIAFDNAGPGVILSYGLAAVLVFPVMFSQAELATAMPRSGGTYFYIERSMGPLVGTFAGLANWLAITLKSTFALVGIGALVNLVLPQSGPMTLKITAIACCLFFSGINMVGTRSSGRLQTTLVMFLLCIIGLYVLFGFNSMEPARFSPFMPAGWQAVIAVAGMVFVSYGGLTKVASVSEEVRNPARNLPLGMFLAFGIVSALYVLVVFVTVGVLERDELRESLAPITLGAKTAMGLWGAKLIGIAALLAFATTANSGILAASRSPMAMSRDGLLPGFLAQTNKRFGTPHRSILMTTLLSILVIALLSVEALVKTASAMMLIVFMLVSVSVIIMRQSGIQNYRPTFRCPLYPWMQIFSIVCYIFLIAEMGTIPLLITGGFALMAAMWYIFYIRLRIERESAIVYLVRNIIASEFYRSNLEDELKTITLERDEVTEDRFDRLIRDCVVLDIKERISATDFLKKVSEALGKRIGQDPDMLYELFIAREKEATTVIRPGLAIPHIIVPGEGVFQAVLVRCKPGIVLSEIQKPVTTAFVLAGTRDERNFHLRALMHIAHIVEEPGFEARWNQARDSEQLRDAVLLSQRSRIH